MNKIINSINNQEEVEDFSVTDDSDQDDLDDEDDSEMGDDYNDVINTDFDDVLQLTEYTDKNELRQSDSYVVAEYVNIEIANVSLNHQKIAKNIVGKITKFILDFNDIDLSDDHKSYLKEVAKLQVSQLADLLSLVEINKQMLENMVRRVNSVQAEDYAMIQTYISLSNQHLKLYKDLQNTYKNIPAVLRKMRTDVIDSNNLLEQGKTGDEVITENFGESQFNNSKQMLKQIKERKELKAQQLLEQQQQQNKNPE
jgi:hypothetical protein